MSKPVRKKKIKPGGTTHLMRQAIGVIRQARVYAVKQTNSLMVFTYFQLGRLIVEHEQSGARKALYGKEILARLSQRLTREFGTGFSPTNLEYMRTFYMLFQHKTVHAPIPQTLSEELENTKKGGSTSRKSKPNPIPQTVSEEFNTRKKTKTARAELFPAGQFIELNAATFAAAFPLSWSHYVMLCRIKNEDERNFYEIESKHNHWSVRELQRQYDSGLFERRALSKNKKKVKELAKKGQLIEQPEDVLKSPYILEFLGLGSQTAYTESDLEAAVISKIEHFLLEMGKGFMFGGRQVRFSFDGEDFYVDLVLYNRLLRCFVLVDLKIGKLRHQDIGQMQMYVNYYDRLVKTDVENPTIGIIICKDKSDAVVEITLPKDNKTIFAREYKLYLPTKTALKKIIGSR